MADEFEDFPVANDSLPELSVEVSFSLELMLNGFFLSVSTILFKTLMIPGEPRKFQWKLIRLTINYSL